MLEPVEKSLIVHNPGVAVIDEAGLEVVDKVLLFVLQLLFLVQCLDDGGPRGSFVGLGAEVGQDGVARNSETLGAYETLLLYDILYLLISDFDLKRFKRQVS